MGPHMDMFVTADLNPYSILNCRKLMKVNDLTVKITNIRKKFTNYLIINPDVGVIILSRLNN